MPRINRQPAGYLDLVDAQGGLFPNTAADVVVPTVDLTNMYMARSLAQDNASFATMGIGDNVSVQVPPNEVWKLISVEHSFVIILAGDFCTWEVQIENLPNAASPLNRIGIHTAKTDIATATGGVLSSNFVLPEPMFLPAGVVIRSTVETRAVNARPWSANYGFYRLRG